MTIKIGINGFGRMGRMVMRAALTRSDIQIVGINDPFLSPKVMAYFLKYDSVHGRSAYEIRSGDDFLEVLIEGCSPILIPLYKETDPSKLPWGQVKAQYILECTGQFLTGELAQAHLSAGAKSVVLSAPSKDATPMFVMGVNHEKYAGEPIVSNASCTTNCLAPIAKVLHDEVGIVSGLMTTVHAVTASQKVTDSMPAGNLRLGRAAFQNIIPASTGAAKAVGKVLPELEGKLTGMAFRVPVQDVSVVDLTCQLKKKTDIESIRGMMKVASEGPMAGVLRYTHEALVSSDLSENLAPAYLMRAPVSV